MGISVLQHQSSGRWDQLGQVPCALALPLERDVIVLGMILSLAGGCIQGYLIYSSFITPVQLHSPSCPSWTGLKHGFRSSIRQKGRWSFLSSLNTLPCHSQERPSCCWGGGMLPAVCAPLEQGLRAVFLSPPVSTQIPLLLKQIFKLWKGKIPSQYWKCLFPQEYPFIFSPSVDDYLILATFLFNFLFLFLLVEELFFLFHRYQEILTQSQGNTCGSRSSLAVQRGSLLQ